MCPPRLPALSPSLPPQPACNSTMHSSLLCGKHSRESPMFSFYTGVMWSHADSPISMAPSLSRASPPNCLAPGQSTLHVNIKNVACSKHCQEGVLGLGSCRLSALWSCLLSNHHDHFKPQNTSKSLTCSKHSSDVVTRPGLKQYVKLCPHCDVLTRPAA